MLSDKTKNWIDNHTFQQVVLASFKKYENKEITKEQYLEVMNYLETRTVFNPGSGLDETPWIDNSGTESEEL
jgi:hypothetical protein